VGPPGGRELHGGHREEQGTERHVQGGQPGESRSGLGDGPARGVDAVLTTPTHQFPTGVTLAPHRRAQLLTWAIRAGAVVVEDDYDGEFRLDRRPTAALQGSAPDRVVYIGSTSKALAPALRLGWLISPPELLGRLIETKFLTDHGSGVIDQIALAEMITKGDYDRHIRLSRTRYRARREAVETAIIAHRVPVRLAGIPAGAQTLATLPTGLDPVDLVERAATAGIVLDSITRYQHTTHGRGRSLVLGYGNITPRRIDGAMSVLGHLISTV
jgi:GntR family transcriptional regulator/MocR family aminotransferase